MQAAISSKSDALDNCMEQSQLIHSKATCCSHYLDLLPVLEVDPGGHISSQLNKPLLPRCDV